MREIKFRSWNEQTKSLGYCNPFDGLEDMEFDWQDDLMQFTGLLDKEGVEIYEGDIVNVKHIYIDKDTLEPTHIYFNGEVKYDEFCFRIGDYPLYVWSKEIEVIGNIYENHERLES